MTRIHAHFSFFKAGQGAFYGGHIHNLNIGKTFSIVHDCGTSPFISGNSQSLNKEITHFKQTHFNSPTNDEIELLFISHLDYDHVSGLKRLLKEFKVKNIILPYIEKHQRRFFLISFNDNKDMTDDDDPDNDLSLKDYINFIENPAQFITQNSEETIIYFIKPNDNPEIPYEGYNNDTPPDLIYARGRIIRNETEEVDLQQNVLVYDNNLQFFIQAQWEFTTYVKSANQIAIDKLHDCLKKILNKGTTDNLTLDDLKYIVTTKRKDAHKCYTNCIGEINSHGLVLLHGPIGFHRLHIRSNSETEVNSFYKKFNNSYINLLKYSIANETTISGTLLFGDTSINPSNNPVKFPVAFINKLVNVHTVQVPHHGSYKNWNLKEYNNLRIGANKKDNLIHVCNFGYGNKYGHPSHQVLNDMCSTIFLNSQFSRHNLEYHISY